MGNIRAHFTIKTDQVASRFILADKVIPGWAIPRQGDVVRLDDHDPMPVQSVVIQYQSGLGDSLNPTLVEVRLGLS